MDRPKINLFVVLVGFPLIYFLYSLTPWAKELFMEGDSSLFIPFWSVIAVLHWLSFFLVKDFLKRENKTLKDIGYRMNTKKTVVFIVSYLLVALLVLGFTEISLRYVSIDQGKLATLSNFFPKTTAQRIFFILTVFTAGVCEEIVYRGYAITQLRGVGVNRWLAVILAGMVFVFMHGLNSVASIYQFLFYFAFSILFGGLFLWRKSLIPNIVIHILFDLMAMMAIFQATVG